MRFNRTENGHRMLNDRVIRFQRLVLSCVSNQNQIPSSGQAHHRLRVAAIHRQEGSGVASFFNCHSFGGFIERFVWSFGQAPRECARVRRERVEQQGAAPDPRQVRAPVPQPHVAHQGHAIRRQIRHVGLV
jgi:hypothetical protein